MKIEVLGPGCRSCEILYQNVLKALEMAGSMGSVEVEKIREPEYFLKMGVFTTPGLIINGEVVSTARVLTPEQVLEILKAKNIGSF
ncbi:MAG: thioredoxin family protein [Thermodesulfobacteriota bacterium]